MERPANDCRDALMMDSEASNTAGGPARGWFTPRRFAAVLGLLLFAAFPRVLLGLDSFFFRDYGVLGYPFVFYHREAFWRGEIPFWNPLSNCGAPFLAQWGTMALYPFSLIYLLFPLPWSLTLFCFGHLFWGGLGMYFLARRWTDHASGAAVAGAAYVFSGAMFSSLIWPNYQVALGWMPWVVLAMERARQEGGKWVVAGAGVGVLQMLSGVPELVAFTWALVALFWIGALFGAGPSRWRLVQRGLLVVLLMVGLAAVQLLPFLDLLLHSQRDRAFATGRWAMPGWGWANFLVPLFHCFKSHHGPYFQHGQEFLTSYYLGTGLLVLAAVAAARVREPRVWMLTGTVALSLVLALGDAGHVYAWLRKVFPPIGVARFTVKFVFLTAFAVPLLAAFALNRLSPCGQQGAPTPGPQLNDRSRERGWVLICALVLLILIALVLWFEKTYPFPYDYWPAIRDNGIVRALFLGAFVAVVWLLPKWTAHRLAPLGYLGLIVLIFADALTHTAQQNLSIPSSTLGSGLWPQQTQLPSPRLGESRVMISPEAERQLLNSEVRDPKLDFIGKRLALWSNLNLLDGIPKVNGSSTLQLREQAQVQSLIYSGTNQFVDGLIDFLAVSHRTKPGTVVGWEMRTNWLPLVACGQAPLFESSTNTLRGLVSPDFDPRRMVYLPLEARGQITATQNAGARIISQRFAAHRIDIVVETPEPALVTVAQSFHPAWRARIDGRPTALLRANHAFQALEVRAGRHQIVLVYRDRWFFIGAVISGFTLLSCAGHWIASGRRLEVEPSKMAPPARELAA